MIRPAAALASFSLVALTLAPSFAEAQTRHHHVAQTTIASRPLTVTGRSWLDVGNVVAVDTHDSNLAASTVLNQPIYSSFTPDKFGGAALPGRFELAFSNENPRGPESGGIFFDTP